MLNTTQTGFFAVIVGLVVGVAMPAWAVDGVVLIDQNKALAGNVTPGDAPGFPIWITQPGSYRLAGNLTVADAKTSAIEIRSSNVTIDLNGFTIQGPGIKNTNTPPVTGYGVSSLIRDAAGTVLLAARHISVTNGTIAGMGAGGISLDSNVEVTHMRIHDNWGFGIEVVNTPSNALIADNVLANNVFNSSAADILAGTNSVVRGNVGQSIGLFCGAPSGGSLIGNTATQILTDAFCTRSQNSPAP